MRPGDTLEELKVKVAQLADDLSLAKVDEYMVDFSAMAVMRGREILFYAVFYEGEHTKPGSKIEFVETDNPRFRTAEGVGPGMLISDAAKIYGPAKLGYNTENESRESVTFGGKDSPDSNISFRPVIPTLGVEFAGIYPEAEGPWLETGEYHLFAVVHRIAVFAPAPGL